MPKCNQCNQPKTVEQMTWGGRVHKNCPQCCKNRRRGIGVENHRARLPTDGPYLVKWVDDSKNRKLGAIPEAYVSSVTCPPSCQLYNNGCYGEHGYLREHWRRASTQGLNWNQMLERVRALPVGQLWRYAMVGDLPGVGEAVDDYALSALVRANYGRRGFGFTHKRSQHAFDAVRYCNATGFTMNLSANNLWEADDLRKVGPVVVLIDPNGPVTQSTPNGTTVIRCPATYVSGMNCGNCGICHRRSELRVIVGFPAHGLRQKRVLEVLQRQSSIVV